MTWIDYSRSYILSNYKLKDPSKGMKYKNMEAIRTFVGVEGEAGFILTHVLINKHSAAIVYNIEELLRNLKFDRERF